MAGVVLLYQTFSFIFGLNPFIHHRLPLCTSTAVIQHDGGTRDGTLYDYKTTNSCF